MEVGRIEFGRSQPAPDASQATHEKRIVELEQRIADFELRLCELEQALLLLGPIPKVLVREKEY